MSIAPFPCVRASTEQTGWSQSRANCRRGQKASAFRELTSRRPRWLCKRSHSVQEISIDRRIPISRKCSLVRGRIAGCRSHTERRLSVSAILDVVSGLVGDLAAEEALHDVEG